MKLSSWNISVSVHCTRLANYNNIRKLRQTLNKLVSVQCAVAQIFLRGAGGRVNSYRQEIRWGLLVKWKFLEVPSVWQSVHLPVCLVWLVRKSVGKTASEIFTRKQKPKCRKTRENCLKAKLGWQNFLSHSAKSKRKLNKDRSWRRSRRQMQVDGDAMTLGR